MRKIFFNNMCTSHGVAKELLSKTDEFLTVTVGDREYSIRTIKNISEADYEELLNAPKMNKVSADSVYNYFHNENNSN